MFDEGEDELLHEIDVLTNVCKAMGMKVIDLRPPPACLKSNR